MSDRPEQMGAMPDTTCHMSISLDGFVAGPEQSREYPLGKRGREPISGAMGARPRWSSVPGGAVS
jgi:hypothetical protein